MFGSFVSLVLFFVVFFFRCCTVAPSPEKTSRTPLLFKGSALGCSCRQAVCLRVDHLIFDGGGGQPRPQGFSLKKWVGREKALASAGHVYSLNIPEKLIHMQPAGFALTEVERSNNGK